MKKTMVSIVGFLVLGAIIGTVVTSAALLFVIDETITINFDSQNAGNDTMTGYYNHYVDEITQKDHFNLSFAFDTGETMSVYADDKGKNGQITCKLT